MKELSYIGFKDIHGFTWGKYQVEAYNRCQEKINTMFKTGRKVSEELLNASHKQYCAPLVDYQLNEIFEENKTLNIL